MTNREIILGRIREALKIAAPHPAFHGDPGEISLAVSPEKWLPPVGQTLEQQVELFQKNAEDLRAEFRAFATVSEAAQHLKTLASAGNWKKIGRHSGEMTDAIARELGLEPIK